VPRGGLCYLHLWLPVSLARCIVETDVWNGIKSVDDVYLLHCSYPSAHACSDKTSASLVVQGHTVVGYSCEETSQSYLWIEQTTYAP
jgi:hypothetical protein